MESKKLRVVHYVNQFFGGIGGEDKANVGPKIIDGPTGPGRAIQAALGERGQVVATVICGDNYFAENLEKACAEMIEMMRPLNPDVLIAGPAFEAGRYGVACGAICTAAKEKLGIPVVTGMYEENPGVDLYHKEVLIVRTGNSVRTMTESVGRMVALALKLAAGEPAGKPSEDGYVPRGIIVNETSENTGAERVVAMLLAKVQGSPFVSEVSQPKYEPVAPAPPIKDISRAVIALVTDGGLVPKGNPDRIESASATHFGKYSHRGSGHSEGSGLRGQPFRLRFSIHQAGPEPTCTAGRHAGVGEREGFRQTLPIFLRHHRSCHHGGEREKNG